MQTVQRETNEKTLKRRLRFEEMLSDLSARFMATPFEKLDSEINNALRQIMEFFQVDRCALLEIRADKAFARVTHIEYGEGIEQVSGETNLAELFPWSYERLMQGKHLNIHRLEDFPEEALKDRQSFAAMGIKSTLTIPLFSSGRIPRIILIQQTRRHQTWPEEYIPRLHLLGDILVNALERREDRLRSEEELQFKTLLSEISTRFVNLPADRIDSEIEDAQRRVCELLNLDRSTLWQACEAEPGALLLTHWRLPSGSPLPPERMNAHHFFPWTSQKVLEGETVIISKLTDLPPEAGRDLESFRAYDTKSTLLVPLSVGEGPVFGLLGFAVTREERSWPETAVRGFKLIAQVFANALARKQAEQTLRESEARLSLTTDAVEAGLWIMKVDTGRVWVSPKSRELFQFAPDEEICYESFFRVIHPEDRDRVHQEVQGALQSGENLLSDYRIVLQDGSIRWIVTRGQRLLRSNGDPERLMGLSLDITERKKMELELSESQTLLASLVNSTSDMIWSVDSDHFGLLTFNRGLSEYFLHNHGIDIKAGMRPEDLLPADYAQQWHMFYRQALEEGSFTTEYSTCAGNRVQRLNINSLRRGDSVFGVSVFAQDITERKQMEEKLKEHLNEIEALKQRLERENVYLQEEIKLLVEHTDIVAQSAVMKKVLTQAEQVAQTDSTVLLLGETGTGKELLARALHGLSSRKGRPLVTVNCASLPPTLIESELFGREKGAYTGALTRMVGRFEIADGSTLFLDEIGELPLELQSKLLRVLEDGTFERLGSTTPLHVNVRIIAATNRDIEQEVKEGKFRRDLFYRLNVFPIVIPPLRQRPEDIPLLIRTFVKEFQKRMGKEIESIPKKTMQALQSYSWPGNVRELRNLIEHAMILTRGKTLDVPVPKPASAEKDAPGKLKDMEQSYMVAVLEKTGWRIAGQGGAAEVLGLKRTTLQSKMKKLGIKRSNKTMPE